MDSSPKWKRVAATYKPVTRDIMSHPEGKRELLRDIVRELRESVNGSTEVPDELQNALQEINTGLEEFGGLEQNDSVDPEEVQRRAKSLLTDVEAAINSSMKAQMEVLEIERRAKVQQELQAEDEFSTYVGLAARDVHEVTVRLLSIEESISEDDIREPL